MTEHGPNFIAALLGTWRDCVVYLPLYLSLPWARLASIVRDSHPLVILIYMDSVRHISHLQLSVTQVIDISCRKRTSAISRIFATAHSPAVMLYTSGSFGTPNGILVKHEGLRNWAETTTRVYHTGREWCLN